MFSTCFTIVVLTCFFLFGSFVTFHVFEFVFENKSKTSQTIIKHSPKTQLKSSLIGVKLKEKPYFKGPTPSPAPGI